MGKANRVVQADVVIAGAGPVGMTLAIGLAGRGIKVAILERGRRDVEPTSRCNTISSRTMEIWRRLGLSRDIGDAGMPDWFPTDVSYVTALEGYELCRLKFPPRNDAFAGSGYGNSGWPTAEPIHRCNQLFFEPILLQRVLKECNIRTFFETEFEEASQDEQGVLAVARNLVTGDRIEFEARFLVGCDGGQSRTRKVIGANLEGVDVLTRTRTAVIRSPHLLKSLAQDPAWMFWFIHPENCSTLVSLDGDELWTIHMWLPHGQEGDFDAIKPDVLIPNIIGKDVEYEVLAIDDWYGRRLISNKFSEGRILLCGDAAHIWPPFAGYLMNSGIADADDLTWQIDAVLKGWGKFGLLRGYAAERHQATYEISEEIMSLALRNLNSDYIKTPSPNLVVEGPEGDAARKEWGEYLYDVNMAQYAPIV